MSGSSDRGRTQSGLASIKESIFPNSRYPDPRVTHPSSRTEEDEQVIKMHLLWQMTNKQETEYWSRNFKGTKEELKSRPTYTAPYIDPGIEILETAPTTSVDQDPPSEQAGTSASGDVDAILPIPSSSATHPSGVSAGHPRSKFEGEPLVPTHPPILEWNTQDPWPRFPLTISVRSVGARRKPMFPRSALSFDVFDMASSKIPTGTSPNGNQEWLLKVKDNVNIPGTLRSVFDDKEASHFEGLQDAGEKWKLDRIEWTGPGSRVGKVNHMGWGNDTSDSDWVFRRME
ncbi:hypothetical protein B9479_006574 [Cryptococcus floricola]|uniref:Uncharacterized protein n=1 Tax=Cryptococcus floricola TaxID=2591691 RepID=A0A5D3ARI3_9TREE|nr:hypothetical protein B9479_006574 [Cryptococcus floricola]